MTTRRAAILLALCAALAAAPACRAKRTALRRGPPAARPASAEPARPDPAPAASGVDEPEPDIRGPGFEADGGLRPVRFGYDDYRLDDPARAVLKLNAGRLRRSPGLDILVAGHCDERGTIQYNLALGQRRAKAVRDYYLRLGIPGRSVATISYGEERPACAESTGACWASNRRAETLARPGRLPARR